MSCGKFKKSSGRGKNYECEKNGKRTKTNSFHDREKERFFPSFLLLLLLSWVRNVRCAKKKKILDATNVTFLFSALQNISVLFSLFVEGVQREANDEENILASSRVLSIQLRKLFAMRHTRTKANETKHSTLIKRLARLMSERAHGRLNNKRRDKMKRTKKEMY